MQNIYNLTFSNPNHLLDTLQIQNVVSASLIVQRFGFQILKTKHMLLDDCTLSVGSISVHKNTKRKIYLDNRCSAQYNRFLIAYLFSCYQLYYDKQGEYFMQVFRETLYDKAAYFYALDLLMPDGLFLEEDLDNKEYLNLKYRVSECLIDEKIKHIEKKKHLAKAMEKKGFMVIE